MISTKVINDVYYFISQDEYALKIIGIFIAGIFLGWLYTLLYFEYKKKKELKKAYADSLDDKAFRKFIELEKNIR